MANRKIRDARDTLTNELIYFKSHAGATYMSNGATVEDAINDINVRGVDITDIDLSNYYTKNEINSMGFLRDEDIQNKQDIISDIDDIRYGAALGATALQSVPSEYVTETELNNKGYLTSVPSEYVTDSELNAKGYLTEHQSLTEYAKTNDVEQMIAEAITTALNTEL